MCLHAQRLSSLALAETRVQELLIPPTCHLSYRYNATGSKLEQDLASNLTEISTLAQHITLMLADKPIESSRHV